MLRVRKKTEIALIENALISEIFGGRWVAEGVILRGGGCLIALSNKFRC